MSGTQTIVMGDRGRLVVPADLRARQRWSQGTALIAVETSSGVLLLTRREELERLVAAQLAGRDVVSELIEERRAAARDEAG